MNLEIFSDNLDGLFDAPNSVDNLRELILTLAIRGKLVPQNPNDEHASKLINKINSEKEQLITEKKIRSPTLLPPVESNSIPFQIPENWQWVRLGNVGQIRGGGTPKTNYPDYFVEKGIPWLTPADLYKLKEKFITRGKRDISEIGLKKSSAQLMPAGTVIFSSRAPIGYVAIALNELTTNQGFKSCIPFVMEMNEYIYYFLKFAGKEIDRNASGTTFKEVSGKIVNHILLPLPPLEEQKRIVTKVDQLMALCDQLEASQQKKHEKRIRLNNAALDKLLTVPTPEEFAQHWQRICDNFDLLYDAPETVGQLRQAILQLAVQGKLVAQDEGGEPALNQLKIISEIKELNLKQGKLQKDKKYSPIMRNNPPWHIPQSWVWIRLQDILELSRGGSPRPSGDPKYFGGDIPWITVNEITKDTEKYLKKTKSGLTELGMTKSRLIYPDDLLLTNSGATLGVPKISTIKGCINDGVARLNIFHKYVNKEYAYYFLFQQIQTFRSVNQGMGQPNLNTSILAGWFFPLPPFEEQNRIVAKVDQLMSLCDELEAGLVKAQTDGGKLMEAVVHQLSRD